MSATDLARLDAKRRHLYALVADLTEKQLDLLLKRAGEMFRERLEDEMRVRNVVSAGLAELRDAEPIVAPRFMPAACAATTGEVGSRCSLQPTPAGTTRTPPAPFPGAHDLGGED